MVAAAAAAATSSSATSTSNLCHARTSHLANMGLCRHGPQQRRLDLARPPIMIRTARPGLGGPAGRPRQGPPPVPGCGCWRLGPGRAPACRGGPCLACWADYYNPLFLQQGSFIRVEGEGAGTALMGARQIILK